VIEPRDAVQRSQLAEHGGRNAVQAGGRDPIVDFSVCLNAFGPADVVRNAIRSASIDEYPEPNSHAVRELAAARWGVDEREIVFGAGTAELIHAICFAFVRVGDRVVVGAPGFGEYARAAGLCSAQVSFTPFSADERVIDAFAREITSVRPRLVFVASPMNPTGDTIPLQLLERVAEACASTDALLVLDQAYDAFVERPVGCPALASHDNVVHLRSLTKEHALPGVRAGFAIAPARIAAAIEAVRVPWAASAPAQAAAIATFSTPAQRHATDSARRLREERARIIGTFESCGFDVRATATHFFIVHVANGARMKAELLREHNLLVRDCASFGLPEWIRIAARTPSENDRLIEALSILSSRLDCGATA